ncbi:hypothetical protein DERF_005038 [Dermatophagoides farinae]|uniref:Uncharacterized protein n=1 Tax=Dermatophagoides farinae TaxID=6954 RepID=A0A922I361_DERFA|nr:hypothetical protein DERF_005038 [Dermatophagoides farinae]
METGNPISIYELELRRTLKPMHSPPLDLVIEYVANVTMHASPENIGIMTMKLFWTNIVPI